MLSLLWVFDRNWNWFKNKSICGKLYKPFIPKAPYLIIGALYKSTLICLICVIEKIKLNYLINWAKERKKAF